MGLGWRLAALHHGWAKSSVLDDYEHERRSVGEATSRAAKQIGNDIESLAADPRLHEDTPEGARLRAEIGAYEPSTEPGARLPHHWLVEGDDSVFDCLGQGFILLRVGNAPPADRWITAARENGVPITVLDRSADAAATYACALVLVRPDMYVAWSGDETPESPRQFLGALRGDSNARVALSRQSEVLA